MGTHPLRPCLLFINGLESTTYTLIVKPCTEQATLLVELEQHDTAERWSANFTSACTSIVPTCLNDSRASDMEEITRKTGSFKRFEVLVKMLLSALQTESSSVYVDLLTFSDLVREIEF